MFLHRIGPHLPCPQPHMHFDNSEPAYYSVDDPSAARIMEKDYYSNFICCGIRLGDLHELVNHFEEHHAQATLSSFPESRPEPAPPPSPIIESPVSACPLTPSPPNLFPTLTAPFTPATALSSTIHPDSSAYSENNYPREVRSFDRSYSELILHDQKKSQVHPSLWSSSASGACTTTCGIAGSDAYAIHSSLIQPPSNAEPSVIPQPPIHLNLTPECTPKRKLVQGPNDPSKSHDFPPTLAPTPVYARHPNLSIITDLSQDLLSSPDEGGRSIPDVPALVDSKETNQSQSSRRKKVLHSNNLKPVREKTYKCPHAGCVKSYLNLNGLKYHLTKGVCSHSS